MPNARPGPTRLQKRWSGRLRTAGALLLLLGAVALADRLLDLAAPSSPLAPTGRGRGVPLAIIATLLAGGAGCFALGRRWQ